jgi:hypothetical protein
VRRYLSFKLGYGDVVAMVRLTTPVRPLSSEPSSPRSESLLDPDPRQNTAEDMIANIEDTADCKGNWIKASVEHNGKFTVTNSRNGSSDH